MGTVYPAGELLLSYYFRRLFFYFLTSDFLNYFDETSLRLVIPVSTLALTFNEGSRI